MTTLGALLALSDSRLPVGGHVHSGGMEEAITSGIVKNIGGVGDYLRRRIRTAGLVTGSIAAAVCRGEIDPAVADIHTDARTVSPAARAASRAQGRGYLRLAKHVWFDHDWTTFDARPHAPSVVGVIGARLALSDEETALAFIYASMTGAATAAQRLLALDPADIAAVTFDLARECAETAQLAAAGLADAADPLQDLLAERHSFRERPLFVS